MIPPARTLRRQIVAGFLAFAALLSLLFAGSSFLVAYIVEDSLFEATVAEEAARQREHWLEHRRFAATGRDWISVHAAPTSLPADLRRAMGGERAAGEYWGDAGRHYHVAPLGLDDAPAAFVVAEVGERLAVRPMQGDLLAAIGLLSAAILIAAAALGYWLARRATEPLSRLVESVSRHEPGTAPAVSSDEYPRNEVGTLAMTIEAMLERTRAFVERETRFTRDASHELRTPLAVIRSSAELIESKGGVPPAIAAPFDRIRFAARQMEQSVELLLMLAREERPATSAPIPLLALVESAVLDESLACGASGAEVSVAVPDDTRTALDARSATTIIANLVRNAFQHGRGSEVTIKVDGADLVIGDRGSGVGPAPQGSRAPGLGLAIVSRLCSLNHIPFSLKNREGGGAEARVGLVAAGRPGPSPRRISPANGRR